MEKTSLKATLKAYRARIEAQGLNFNYDEAQKLKKLF